MDCGKHELVLEHETIFDNAALEYAKQLEGTTIAPVVSSSVTQSVTQRLSMGWAFKGSGSKRKRFSATQQRYLAETFKIGEATEKKADPASVARSMISARDANGTRLFTSEEFLTATQIAGFFSRLASKKGLVDDETDDENEAAVVETELNEMLSEVLEDLTPKHPLVYDRYNLCELSSKGKLGMFAIPVLKDMLNYFGISITEITVKRRKPYVDKL